MAQRGRPKGSKNGQGKGKGKGKGSQLDPARLAWIEAQLTRCRPRYAIERVAAASWHVTERAVRYYIEEVHRRWAAESDANRPAVRDHIRAGLHALYQTALDSGDLKTCARIWELLTKLDGADAPARVEVTQAAPPITDPKAAAAELHALMLAQMGDVKA